MEIRSTPAGTDRGVKASVRSLPMSRRVFSAFCACLGTSAAVGCATDPPADLSHLPRDATAIWGVDVGAIASWAGADAPGPLAQLGSAAVRDGVAACGLDLAALDIVGAGSDRADLVIVLRAPGIGDTSTLSCLGSAKWRTNTDTPWWTVDGAELHRGDGTAIGRVISSDAVVLATDPAAHDLEVLAQGSEEAWSEPMREALASVDPGAAIWGALVPAAAAEDTTADPSSVALHVAVPGELEVQAVVRTAEPEAMAETIEAKLREVAGWVYAPPSVVDRAEIEAGEGRVALRISIALPQWQGMDLRWIDERRGLVAPEPEPQTDTTDEPPKVARVELPAIAAPVPEVVAAAVGPTGLAACDEYLTKYRACVEDKMPESVRETALKALDQSADAWKIAAATPAARSSLDEACKAASAAAEQATTAMGCTW